MRIGTARDDLADRFRRHLAEIESPAVAELGTRRWDPKMVTHHAEWVPHAQPYLRCDIDDGDDVDLVTDAHTLDGLDDHSWDAVVAVSIFEHLARPWYAAHAIARVLRSGGLVYVATHQTFPIHGYPNDYWRFSSGALDVLFGDAGLAVESVGYQYPCRIEPGPEVTRWNSQAEAYLNVSGIWRKP